MIWKKCKILFVLLLIQPTISFSCGWDGFSYEQLNYLLSPYDVQDKYFNYQFDGYYAWYGNTENVNPITENIKEWASILKVPADSALYSFIYEPVNIDAPKTKYATTADVTLAVKNKKLNNYFELLQQYLVINDGYSNTWGYNTDSLKLAKALALQPLINTAEQQLKNCTDTNMWWRQFYMLLRMPFFNNDYTTTMALYNEYILQAKGDGLAKEWVNGLVAGSNIRQGNTARGKLQAALCFMNSKDQHHSMLLTYKQAMLDVQEVLAICQNNTDSLAVLLCESCSNPMYNTQVLQYLVDTKQETDILPIIWIREIQKAEQHIFYGEKFYYNEDYASKMDSINGVAHAKQLLNIANAYLSYGKKHKTLLASSIAYIYNEFKEKNTRDYYISIAKQSATTPFDNLQVQLIILAAQKEDNTNNVSIATYLQAITDLDKLQLNNYSISNAKQFINMYLMQPYYLENGDTANAILCGLIGRGIAAKSQMPNDYLNYTMYGNPYYTIEEQQPNINPNEIYFGDNYDYLIETCSKEVLEKCHYLSLNKNEKENILLPLINKYLSKDYNKDYFNYLRSALHMREENWSKALEIYKTLPQDLQMYKGKHPYIMDVQDIIRYWDSIPNAMPSIGIIERASILKTKIDAGSASGKDYLDYANLLYTTSAHGTNHFLMSNHFRYKYMDATDFNNPIPVYGSYSYSNNLKRYLGNTTYYIPKSVYNFITTKHVLPYVDKAIALLKDPADLAKCYYLQAKVFRNNIFSDIDGAYAYLEETKYKIKLKKYTNSVIKNPYFAKIKATGKNATTQKIYNECSTYRAFYNK